MSSVNAIISGTGSSVPSRVVTNADLEKIVDTSDEWIVTRTGIKERRIAEEGEHLAPFCIEACRHALDAAGVTPDEIDLIILATVTPDMPLPATACTIQHELGCRFLSCAENHRCYEKEEQQTDPPLPENRHADETGN